MINARAYQHYFGGKSGNGTYQTIINNIPPHDIFMSLYLGNCGIVRHIKEAKFNLLNDIDPEVMQNWGKLQLPSWYKLTNHSALSIIERINDFIPPGIGSVFIFLDPPYRKDSRKCQADIYKFEVDEKHHTDLLSQINAIKRHKVMITHYPDPVYDAALKHWNKVDFYSMTRNGIALERMYMNYDLIDNLLHDYSYIGKDFREREAFERIRKNLSKKLKRLPDALRNAIISDITSH